MWLVAWMACGGDDGTAGDGVPETGVPDTGAPDPTDDTGDPPVGCPAHDGPELATSTGCVWGGLTASGREQFLGIPFAEPPVGALRFGATVPVAPWTEPLDATALGEPCVQFGQGPFNELEVGTGSEDCLTLNVYRPAGATDLPVMFFVHGGGHVGGSATASYLTEDPALAEEAVVVTIQYRLGPLGYLAHPALSEADPQGVSGNQGLQDVITALGWVSANLEVLGGDPDRLVVFGESAGGLETCAVLAAPQAADLGVDAAIIQSAPCHALSTPLRDPPLLQVGGEDQGVAFAEALGCDGAADIPACLRDVPIATVVETGAANPGLDPTDDGWSWKPWVDGVWIPTALPQAFLAGDWNRVPVLATVNADEGTIFTVGQAPTEEALEGWISVWSLLLGVDEAALAAQYDPVAYGSPDAAYAALFGDLVFVCPTVWQQEVLAGQVDARGAWWTHVTLTEALGAFHASEMPYVFGTLSPQLAGPDDQDLSARMRDAWRSMATAAPAIGPVGLWPTVDVGWVELDLEATRIVETPRADRCALFEDTRGNPYRR